MFMKSWHDINLASLCLVLFFADHAAQKVSAIQNSETSALKSAAQTKDTSLSAASAALEASEESDHHSATGSGAWPSPPKVVHVSHPWG